MSTLLPRRAATVAIALLSGPLGLAAGVTVAHAASVTTNCAGLQAALTAAGNGDVVTLQDDHLCTETVSMPTGIQMTLQGGTGTQGFDDSGAGSLMSLQGPGVKGSTVRDLTFINGKGVSAGGGAAAYFFNDSSPQLINLRFFSSNSVSNGGAVSIQSSATTGTILVSGCTFGSATDPTKANIAAGDGGALDIVAVTSVSLVDNTFAGNTSMSDGGGAHISVSSSGSSVTATGNHFIGNKASGNGGGASIRTRDPVPSTLSNNEFRANHLTTAGSSSFFTHLGGGLFLGYPPVAIVSIPTSATQVGNVFDSNVIEAVPPPQQGNNQPRAVSSFDYGGGGEWISDVQTTSTRDRFINNIVAASPGTVGVPEAGGLGVSSMQRSTTFTGKDLVAAGNSVGAGGNGGGVYVGVIAQAIGTTLNLFDSTVAGNVVGAGGTYPAISGDPTDVLALTNTIAAANTGTGPQVGGFGTMTATYTDTCLVGTATMTGTGNFCADPLLVDPAPGIANVHETATSPTRNKGSNALIPAGLAVDYESDPRIAETVVDVGADEFEPPVVAETQPAAVGLPKAGLAGARWTNSTGALVGVLLVAVLVLVATTRGRRRPD
jgi:hypothetical protein